MSRGGGQGACAPPPLEIEKQKKVIKGNFNYAISPIFCYYFSRKYHFLCYFLSCPPPPLEKVKGKKNCFSDFRPPPPPYEFLDTPLYIIHKFILCDVMWYTRLWITPPPPTHTHIKKTYILHTLMRLQKFPRGEEGWAPVGSEYRRSRGILCGRSLWGHLSPC